MQGWSINVANNSSALTAVTGRIYSRAWRFEADDEDDKIVSHDFYVDVLLHQGAAADEHALFRVRI